jgi:hypothetical protein
MTLACGFDPLTAEALAERGILRIPVMEIEHLYGVDVQSFDDRFFK